MSAQTQMHCSSVHCCSVWRSPQQLTAPHSSLSSQHKNMQQANQKSFKAAPCQYSVTLTWRWRRLGWQNEQEAPGSFTSPSDDGSVSAILTYHHEPFKIWTFCREHDWLAIYTQTNAGFTLVDILFVILKGVCHLSYSGTNVIPWNWLRCWDEFCIIMFVPRTECLHQHRPNRHVRRFNKCNRRSYMPLGCRPVHHSWLEQTRPMRGHTLQLWQSWFFTN